MIANNPQGSADQPRQRRIFFLVAVVVGFNLLVAATLLAVWLNNKRQPPSPDWNGTWKLNAAKSVVPAPTMAVSIAADGTWHSMAGGGDVHFRCDGRERQANEILTAFCTQKSGSDLQITAFRNGSKVSASEWELSTDGSSLTIQSTRFHSDGSVKAKQSRYARTSGSAGFAGVWKDVNPLDGSASTWEISVKNSVVHFSYPERDFHADAVLDGTDATYQGQLASPRTTIALVKRGPRQFGLTYKTLGKVVGVGYWRISDDGRSLTESYWAPGRSNNTLMRVYDKQ
jgi:hypothetical protein